MKELAKSLHLKVSQVYKWLWDRNKSNNYYYTKKCSVLLSRDRSQPLFAVERGVRKQAESLFQISK